MDKKEIVRRFGAAIREQASMGVSLRCYDEEDIGVAEENLLEAVNDLIAIIHRPPAED